MRTKLETPCTPQHEVYHYCTVVPGRSLVLTNVTLLDWYRVLTFVYYENECVVLSPTDGQGCCARWTEQKE